MKKGRMSLLLSATLFFVGILAPKAEAQPFVLSKVVDYNNTPIPDGSGSFTALPGSPVISGKNVAFYGEGSSEQKGIYLFNGTTLSKVADLNTPIPGGSGNFTHLDINPVISDGKVAFWGVGSGQQGIYLFNGTNLSSVADLNTPVPGGSGNFTSLYFPVCSGEKIAFIGAGAGQQGVYLFNGSSLNKVADYNTPVPEGSGNFFSFSSLTISGDNMVFIGSSSSLVGIYLFNGTTLSKVADFNTPIPDGFGNLTYFNAPSISYCCVAFYGQGASDQNGIYLFSGTTLSKVADRNTPIPGGSENFTYFGVNPVISEGNVAFQGGGASQVGVYLFNGTTLSKVADSNTPIPGGTENFFGFGGVVVSSGNVAFWGAGSGQHGIYLFNSIFLRKVADRNTPIPGGSGNFDGLSYPVISGGNVALGGGAGVQRACPWAP